MRKLFTFLLTVVFVSVASSLRAASYEPDEVLTSVSVGDIFAIYNSADDKYLYGIDNQNLGYDIADNALQDSNSGYLFKLEELAGHYVLILQNPGGGNYNFWGTDGYLNSQPVETGWCSFIYGLQGEQYGQDGQDLALWDIETSGDGFKLKNVGTGLYLNSNAPAKFSEDEAVVWTFCTLKEAADEIVSYEPDEVLTEVYAGDIFAIYDSAADKYLFGSGAQNLGFDTADNAFKNTNPGWLFKLSELAGHYVLQLQNADGSGDYALWGNPNNSYLNSQPATGWCSFILSLNGEQYGQDGQDLALWDIEASGNGFKLKNVGTGLYLNSNAPARYSEEDAVVWTFCTLKETSVVNPIKKGTYDATDANTSFFTNFIAIGADATFDSDTKVFKGGACGWQWADGVDFDKYQYIVITVAQNVTDGGWQVHIKDANGLTISGDQYGADFMNLWIGAWNNHNCLKIDLEKIRTEQMFDIHHVTELWIDANRQDGIILGNAYATNQVPENNKNWNNEENGDFKLTIDNNKFATICLPFEASVAGAYVYEIAGKSADGLDLNMYNGILEAGKPYIIQSNENESGNVYFYKATATTVETAGENNGLIGTFEPIIINNKDFYVLSGNKLYYADQDVNVGANKAYIDMTKVGSAAGTKNVSISFGDVTGIENIQVEGLNGKVYDLSGREIIRPAKGFYIANGKKMLIK